MRKKAKLHKILVPILLLLILTLFVSIFYYIYTKQSWKQIKQTFSKTGYVVSIKYPADRWIAESGDNIYVPGYYDYEAFILLTRKDNKDIKIQLEYNLSNNGDDTPVNISETGAPPWPPQPEELIFDKSDDEYHYIGKFLGKKLYVTSPNYYGSVSVVQELYNGKVTGLMPLLSKDKDRVNYYDSFTIGAELGEDKKLQKDLYEEFLQILKTLKIEKAK